MIKLASIVCCANDHLPTVSPQARFKLNENKCLQRVESSMIRHGRQCGLKRLKTPRKRKSCERCALIKTRCDLQQPHCSRCQLKGAVCQYLAIETNDAENNIDNLLVDENTQSGYFTVTPSSDDSYPSPSKEWNNPSLYVLPQTKLNNMVITTNEIPIMSQWDHHDSHDDLMAPQFGSGYVATAELGDYAMVTDGDWLNTLIATEDSELKLNNTDIKKISRVLRTYPTMMARQEQLPPYIHFWQIKQKPIPIPLANCFALTRMWQEKVSETDDLVMETIHHEMDRLLGEVRTSFCNSQLPF
jgi:hypothetical protein